MFPPLIQRNRCIIIGTMKTFESLSFKNRLAISFSMVLALMLISAAFFYRASYQRIEQVLNRQAEAGLSASIRQIDHLLEQVHSAGMLLSSSATFKTLSDSDGSDEEAFTYAAYQMQDELRYLLPPEQLLMDGTLFLYMENSGYLLSASSFSQLSLAEKYSSDYANLSRYALSDGLMAPENWRRFLPLGPDPEHPDGLLYVCPVGNSLMSLNSSTNSVLCLQIDAYQLSSLFSRMDDSSGRAIYAQDMNEGGALALYEENHSQMSPQQLSFLPYHDGAAIFTENRQQMVSLSSESEYNGWTYYLVQPSSAVYASAGSYQKLSLALIAVVTLLECAFIFVLTTYNSRPVDRLSSQLASQTDLASTLTTMVEKARPLVSESYLRRLMEGNVTTNEQMAQIVAEMGLNREGCRYQVLYAQVAPTHAQDLRTEDLKLCIQNYDILVREALNRYFPDTGYIYKPQDSVFACLLALNGPLDDEECTRQNLQLFARLHQELLERYEIEISGGLGGVYQIVSYIWKSCQQARNAQSLTSPERFSASFYELKASSDVYYFPDRLAVQLSGFISTGSQEQVSSVFTQLREENLKLRTLSPTQLRWLISDIRGTVFRKRSSLDPALADTREKTELLDLIDRQFEGEITLDTLESISLRLCSFYGSDTDSNNLIIRIQEFINGNYADPSLSLSRISQEFHISENYFSFLFKKEVSENFSSYLEKLRMAKAKELVMESTTSISELYQYTGYNNAASFRRVFKKTYGVSPREMREKAASSHS